MYMIYVYVHVCIIMEKNVSLWLLCGVQHSVVMTNFIMPETATCIMVIILIIYSPYLLKDLVKYISDRTAISSSFCVSYKQLLVCTVELEHTFYYMPCPIINWWASWNDATYFTYTKHCHVHVSDKQIYMYIHCQEPIITLIRKRKSRSGKRPRI